MILLTGLPLSALGQDPARIADIQTPALEIQDVELISVLRDLDGYLRKHYPDHPNLSLVIDRHPNPPADLGETKISAILPAQSLPERLRYLAGLSLTHWTISDNKIVIFKTWHLGIFDPSPIFPNTNSEAGAAGQPATRSESK